MARPTALKGECLPTSEVQVQVPDNLRLCIFAEYEQCYKVPVISFSCTRQESRLLEGDVKTCYRRRSLLRGLWNSALGKA